MNFNVFKSAVAKRDQELTAASLEDLQAMLSSL